MAKITYEIIYFSGFIGAKSSFEPSILHHSLQKSNF